MQPIVDGIRKEYRSCIQMERVYFSNETEWHRLIGPVGTPEFVLLDSAKSTLHIWLGLTDKEEFTQQLDPLCKD